MEREYICGCGKAYGSYPAFSTHRKTKHNNQTVEGTVIPAAEKSKRGRPSCDFKKIPELFSSRKQYFQGLNTIELGLLELEESFRGMILAGPYEQHEVQLSEVATRDDTDRDRIEAISTFTRTIASHMRKQTGGMVVKFMEELIGFGLRTGELASIQVYNKFCLASLSSLRSSQLGLQFYLQVCLLLSRWLCVMGHSREILKIKSPAVRVSIDARDP